MSLLSSRARCNSRRARLSLLLIGVEWTHKRLREMIARVTTDQQSTPRVFFDVRIVADIGPHISPSSAKPGQVVQAIAEAGLSYVIAPVVPATATDFCLSHDDSYVEGVLAGQIPNGFGGTQIEVIDSLPFTSGAMLSAARF